LRSVRTDVLREKDMVFDYNYQLVGFEFKMPYASL